jgi:hypothetical protein
MAWNEGHVWILKDLPVRSKAFFHYKYVLMKGDKPSTWEAGQNRLADLRKLPERDINFGFDMFNEKKGEGKTK